MRVWLKVAWRNLTTRPVQNLLTALVVALALAVLLVTGAVKAGTTAASQPFDMIVGAKGSSMQLLFNTAFLQDVPVGNIEYGLYQQLAGDPRVASAVPLGLGDNYFGYRIVGTTPEFFTALTYDGHIPVLSLAAGQIFASDFQAVLGAQVAERLGLEIGDSFHSSHGVMELVEAEEHAEEYTVVGVLASSRTPYDTGIFTSLASLWHTHAEQEGLPREERGVTAILISPQELTGLMQLYQEINSGEAAQAIFPGQVMADVFAFLGQSQQVLEAVAWVALVMAAISVVVSLYWATLERRRDLAVLRAIGASRRVVFTVTFLQSLLVVLIGLAVGTALGHGLAYAVGRYLAERLAMPTIPGVIPAEGIILAAVLGLGTVAGLVPAIHAYRYQVAENLATA